MQGELEHRTSKARFARTSRKGYASQLASIERRQARIRTRRDAVNLADPVPNQPEEHHVIGRSQNFPEDLTRFMQSNNGDPATNVSSVILTILSLASLQTCYQHFILKLRAHILPRIAAIHQDANTHTTLNPSIFDFLNSSLNDVLHQDHLLQLNSVLFKGNKIYRHRLLHINYTTYDLQRDFDSINPRTDHRDIMVLSNANADAHPFSYARVLGIFHANIIYTGPGSRDFQSRRIEFLWVRWFEVLQDHFSTWEQRALDMVRFLPVTNEDAFSFVDPADVLRGCHIIPSFADGRLHVNGIAKSRCAGDSDDWKQYYVNR